MNLFKKLMCSVSAVAVSAFLVIPVMAANEAQWKRNDKGWWYEEANGTYPTNAWKLIKDKWYYFDGIGYMVENRWIGNYYLGADGAMLVSTSTPDGYYVDATGKWVEGARNTVNISKTSGSGTKRSSSGGGSSRSGGSGGSGGSRRGGGNSGGSGGSRRSGGSSGGSGGSGRSGGGSGGSGSAGGSSASGNGSGTTSTSTAGNNSIVVPSGNANTGNTTNNNTTPSVNNNVTVPSGNTGNNTVTTPNTTTPAVSTQETQVIEALKAMGLSEKEAKLYYMINAYRESLGLPKLSFSKSLTEVARAHVRDSNAYTPENQVDSRGMRGNLHSWSGNGSWTRLVYTDDHNYANGMWSKPREITNYTGNGYEISSKYSGMISPETAFGLWKDSSEHNEVMITSGMWSDLKTMGVSIDGHYAHVWFGSDTDPDGYYDVANYDVIHP